MLPKTHIFLGLIFSWLAWLLFPSVGFLGFWIIFLSSFLIDVDHYAYYVIKTGNFSLRKSIAWYMAGEIKIKKIPINKRKKFYTGLCFLHGIEAAVILLALSLLSNIFFFILAGFIFHQILDFIDMSIEKTGYHKIISFTYHYLESKKRTLIHDYGTKIANRQSYR